MARKRIFDVLQSYAFWLVDITPSKRPPFFVLGGPFLGFSEISHPEISIQHENIVQMNDPFPEHAFSGAEVGPITMSRGSRIYDSTFYTWVQRYIDGEDVSHRDLLLLQNTGMTFTGAGGFPLAGVALPTGGTEIVRIPGKAWILWDCVPVRYTAGQGLDAMSSDVSKVELEIQPHHIDEYSIDPARIADNAS